MASGEDGFITFVLDQLADVRGVRSKAMFGGHGLYCKDVFFGIISKGRLYFKVSPSTRPMYDAQGMQPFRPNSTQTLTSFYEVPLEILEHVEELATWAEQAIAVSTGRPDVGTRRKKSARRAPRRRQTR